MVGRNPKNLKDYRIRQSELSNGSRNSTNTDKLSIQIPTWIHNDWKKMKARGMKTHLSDIIVQAIYFALYGPHPYEDPLAGLKEALDSYIENTTTKREAVVELIQEIGKQYGLTVEIKNG